MAGFRVFSRRGCHLCELMIERLHELTRDRISIEIHDIDCNDEWRQKYDRLVPVLEFDGGVVCESRLDEDVVAEILLSKGTDKTRIRRKSLA